MHRLRDMSRFQNRATRCGRLEHEMARHAEPWSTAPGDLDGIPATPEQDIREEATLLGGAQRVSPPPLLPIVLPGLRTVFIQVDRRRREPRFAQRRPCGLCRVPGRQTLFVQERIPVRDEPLEQGKKVPVRELDSLAFLLMRTEVPAVHPELEPAPGDGDIRVDRFAFVRVGGEGHLHGEPARVAAELLPSSRHRAQSQYRRRSCPLTLPSALHLRLRRSGTSTHPTGYPCQSPGPCSWAQYALPAWRAYRLYPSTSLPFNKSFAKGRTSLGQREPRRPGCHGYECLGLGGDITQLAKGPIIRWRTLVHRWLFHGRERRMRERDQSVQVERGRLTDNRPRTPPPQTPKAIVTPAPAASGGVYEYPALPSTPRCDAATGDAPAAGRLPRQSAPPSPAPRARPDLLRHRLRPDPSAFKGADRGDRAGVA